MEYFEVKATTIFVHLRIYSCDAVTTRELDICPSTVFSFAQVFCPDTNEGIFTGWSHRSVQMYPSRDALGPHPTDPVQMPHIYTGLWLRSV
jgi:hypothetical protein